MGGLPIVICLGDFNQFEPVKDTALWKTKEFTMDTVKEGQDIWKNFTNVVILTEQMRQKDDPTSARSSEGMPCQQIFNQIPKLAMLKLIGRTLPLSDCPMTPLLTKRA
jgi:hypothetical protein